MAIILKPFAWLLLFFYNFFHSYGLALILFAFIIKLILFPVTLKGKKSMIQMNMLSSKMQQLQKQYGKDRERYNLEVQKLYDRENVSPYGGCLWNIIPLVLLIILLYIIREPLVNLMGVPKDMIETIAEITGVANTGAYPQIAMAKALNDPAILEQVKAALGENGNQLFMMDFSFLGINLADIPTWKFWSNGLKWESIGLFLLPLVSTCVSFLSMQVTMATNKMNKKQEDNEQLDRTNKMMMWTMPLMSLWIGFTVPAGLSVYWIAQYLVTMIQEVVCGRLLRKDYEAARIAAEEQARREKEEEKKRKEEARLERARRAEEEKKNKGKKKSAQKKDDSEKENINRDDSREGIRAYARGRAYIPDRFGGVTEYVDPDVLAKKEPQTSDKDGKKKESAPTQENKEEGKEQLPEAVVEEIPVVEETAAPEEQAVETDTAPVTETEEIEVEVEEIEVEVDENKEGV